MDWREENVEKLWQSSSSEKKMISPFQKRKEKKDI